MSNRLFAALFTFAFFSAPVQAADFYLTLGVDSGWSKQEMQGLGPETQPEPHFSLFSTSRDYGAEIGLRHAFSVGGRDFDLGMTLHHSGPQTVDANQSPHQWIAQTGRVASTQSLSALITLRTPLAQRDVYRLDAGIGLGLARTAVRLSESGRTSRAVQTVPQAIFSLRSVQTIAAGTEIWVEGRYATSPAVRVDFRPDRQIGHEISGWSIGAGVTVLLE